MIHINRNAVDETGRAIKPSDKWFQLAAGATTAAVKEGPPHEAKKSVYADTEVKSALEKLFHDKCGYCESRLPEEWEVEHFRPKGRVAERTEHPGYYWLAYSWENLYASCKHCNQRRTDRPRWADPVALPAGGKAYRFPLSNEDSRAMSPTDNVGDETRLLIDPCSDNPEDRLGYDITGQVFAIDGNRVGKTTIDVFHLSRRRLKDARLMILRSVLELLKLISSAECSAATRRMLQAYLDNRLKADESAYAAVARYVESHSADFGV